MNPKPIAITDPPEVVKLKLEFRDLDMQEENLKERLTGVRQKKATIAQAIFQQTTTPTNTTPCPTH